MTIEIHEPELEAMIQQKLDSGRYKDVEDVLRHALTGATAPKVALEAGDGLSGTELIRIMQACPYPDFEMDFEPIYPQVREVEF
jgi:hypothetical protein